MNGFLDPAAVSGYTLGESNEVGDDSSPWDTTWLNEGYDPLNLNDLGSNGLQANDMQSESLQQHMPHDGIYHKGHTSGHNFAAPPYLLFPHPNHEHPQGYNSWNTLSLEPSLVYSSSPIYNSPGFGLDTQPMPGFANGFRGGNDILTEPAPLMPAQSIEFTADDLGTQVQPLKGDDATSQVSCNSKCTSSVCNNEDCSVTGIPCDDPTCVDNNTPAEVPDLTRPRATQVESIESHIQPCKHTESEHLVARTLGELRAPAEIHAQENSPFSSFQFDTMASHIGGHLYDGDYESYVSSPPQLTADIESSGPKDSQAQLQSFPSLPLNADGAVQPEKLICQWASPHTRQGKVCGAEFTSTKDFHDHLCDDHIARLTSHTGYACLWDGCPRQHGPFVTRGKLRRHVSTHSVYKPFSCDICHQRFSGQQALQQHERIHTGAKPYKCNFEKCTMAFKQKSALTMHLRTHTGEKPLKCEICGKAFPESSNLSKHRKTHAVKSDKYVCNEMVKGEPCGRSFRRLDQLRRHRDTHNPGKKKTAHGRSTPTITLE